MTTERLSILLAWAQAQVDIRRLRTCRDLQRRQEQLWPRFRPVLRRLPALAALADLPHHQLPISTPRQVRADFARWNTVDVSEAEAVNAAEAAERGLSGEVRPGLVAGFSTGTNGGGRGVFLVSAGERAAYIGHALARLLPTIALVRPLRIALCLRADSALYREVVNAGSIRFDFLGLELSTEHRLSRLNAFQPHVLIAPSHILADLARQPKGAVAFPLERLLYGAEPMSEAERAWIHDRLGARPDPIYQATEGFIGAPCRFGTLHLNEDFMIVEREPVPGTTRFRPVITDLRRTSQPVVRLMLDDLLEAAPPCPCGSPMQPVLGIEGRLADLWRYPVPVLPRQVENVLASALGPEQDWRVTASSTSIRLEIDPARATVAEGAIAALFGDREPHPPIQSAPLQALGEPKRRRVRWSGC